MSSSVPTYPLGNLASFKTGKLDSNAAENAGSYPFFTCSPDTLLINSFAFNTEAVLLAGNNANGNFSVKYYSGKFNAYQRTYVIEPLNPDQLSCKYLYYQIRYLVNHLKDLSVGSATKFLTKKTLESLHCKLPSKNEQDQITEILSALDERIILLREMNATLESIAQALFKSCFIDFDPVHAKAEGREPEGIDAETAALFPDSFVESEFGLIPKGWHVGRISNLGEVICGKTPLTSNQENYGSEVPFITIPDMHNRLVVTSTQKKLSHQGAGTQKNKYLRPGSICVSCIATAGLVVAVTEMSQTNQQINSVVPDPKWTDSFSLFVLRQIGEKIRAAGSGGSVFDNLNKSRFEKTPILLPDPKLAQKFDYMIAPLVSRIIANQKQAEFLSMLRDTLLPRLISGQLRLSQVEYMESVL